MKVIYLFIFLVISVILSSCSNGKHANLVNANVQKCKGSRTALLELPPDYIDERCPDGFEQ